MINCYIIILHCEQEGEKSEVKIIFCKTLLSPRMYEVENNLYLAPTLIKDKCKKLQPSNFNKMNTKNGCCIVHEARGETKTCAACEA